MIYLTFYHFKLEETSLFLLSSTLPPAVSPFGSPHPQLSFTISLITLRKQTSYPHFRVSHTSHHPIFFPSPTELMLFFFFGSIFITHTQREKNKIKWDNISKINNKSHPQIRKKKNFFLLHLSQLLSTNSLLLLVMLLLTIFFSLSDFYLFFNFFFLSNPTRCWHELYKKLKTLPSNWGHFTYILNIYIYKKPPSGYTDILCLSILIPCFVQCRRRRHATTKRCATRRASSWFTLFIFISYSFQFFCSSPRDSTCWALLPGRKSYRL